MFLKEWPAETAGLQTEYFFSELRKPKAVQILKLEIVGGEEELSRFDWDYLSKITGTAGTPY